MGRPLGSFYSSHEAPAPELGASSFCKRNYKTLAPKLGVVSDDPPFQFCSHFIYIYSCDEDHELAMMDLKWLGGREERKKREKEEVKDIFNLTYNITTLRWVIAANRVKYR